jgi:hypothetical protein
MDDGEADMLALLLAGAGHVLPAIAVARHRARDRGSTRRLAIALEREAQT